jgi:hypothetical protein
VKRDLDDLESAVCDVRDMANVACLLIDHFHRQTKAMRDMGMSGEQIAERADIAAEPLVFAVYQLSGMAQTLRKAYYAEIEKI